MKMRTMLPFALALVLAASAPARGSEDARPTAGFRAEHAEIQVHLRHLDGMIAGLAQAPAPEQRSSMTFIVGFLDEHIRSHAEWEEARLYPLVDSRACAGSEPFSASMRYEHGIIGRAIDALADLAGAGEPDAEAFARAADRALGLIGAHFEKEEEVFLPILDRTMTRDQLDQALGEPSH